MGRYFEKVNTSPNSKKIKKRLEELGHTEVEVWWEPIGQACEMCGNDGGFFFSSEEMELEPIGYSFAEAMDYLNESWFTIKRVKESEGGK
jgi:CRISPR/Cas system-associated protein Cas10 (large subunit of type III CRISPR-Cas system)